MKTKILSVLVMSMLTVGLVDHVVYAGTIEFENMPELYQYGYGHQNFGNYWQGVNFSPDSTVLDTNWPNDYYNYSGYPPHSGDAVLFSYSTPYIDAIFDIPVDNVSMWYSSTSSFVLDAYDVNDNLIASTSGGPNYGTNSLITISTQGDDIKRLRMHDSGNYFTIDDFTAEFLTGEPTITPIPAAILLLGSGLLGIAGIRRKMKE
jgi:hypothetical protein